jgi:hypothetical protein
MATMKNISVCDKLNVCNCIGNSNKMHSQNQKLNGKFFVEGKITRPNFFYPINFPISQKLFALTILRIKFGHFYSG